MITYNSYGYDQMHRMQEKYEYVMRREQEKTKERERQIQQDAFIHAKLLKDENSQLKEKIQKLEEQAAAVSEF